VNEASNLTRSDTVIVQVVPDVLENWRASSQGEALQQKAHFDCLTLRMKQYNPMKVTYLVAKFHISQE